jgi:hypothetical protein
MKMSIITLNSVVNILKLFSSKLMKSPNKLDHFSLATLSQFGEMLASKVRAYPSGASPPREGS